jgi:signal transduction histidine kinase
VAFVGRESGADPQRDAIDLRRTVETCWRHVDTDAATLTVETDRSILADEGQVRQLLENLVRNAVEHGGDAVTVTVGNLSDGFFVEDDGRGIPEEDRERSLDYGFSTKPDGTGLGLSIVREVVDNHGWCLTVTDGRTGGARFEVSGVSFV